MPEDKGYNVKRGLNGLGLFASKAYRRGDFVIEYTGEKITEEEANERGGRYLFEVSKTHHLDATDRQYTVRYLNHSCRPNCYAELDVDEERIFIYAKKKVAPGDELTFNYGKAYFEQYIAPKGCRCIACADTTRERQE